MMPACSTLGGERTLDDVKARLECVAYAEELPWEQVTRSLGRVDEAPIPGPGSLFKNVRVYRDRVIIFHVDTKEIQEAGHSRFVEVVKTVEVCREK